MTRYLGWLLATVMTACGQQSTTVSVPVLQQDSAVAIPIAQPLSLNSVQWQVMSLADLKNLVATLEKQQQTQVILFSLDPTNYNNLAANFIEIERYIKEQKAILTMLKKIITDRSEAGASAH